MNEESRAYRVRHMSMDTLVKRVTSSTLRRDYLELPEAAEIDDRLPGDLRDWFAHVMFTLREPWHLRGGRGVSDDAYIEHWRNKRDRIHPETHPDYKPPRKGLDGDDGEDGAGDFRPDP